MLKTIAVVGAGNGGKTAAADMALQGLGVRLYEFPDYADNLAALRTTRRLRARGAVEGMATLEMVTSDIAAAVQDSDAVMVCTQSRTLERAARELAPHVRSDQVVVINPGSTGGALKFARVFREEGVTETPVLAEFSTLTYGCRANGAEVECPVKVGRVLYGTLPAPAITEVGPNLEALYPGLRRAQTVLEAGLNNANPVIHPPISLLNGARFEREGARMYFYGEGVSQTVANLIRKLDEERMALLRALGYDAQSDPETSVEQGYATSTDYLECYAHGPGFATFTSPDTLDHRYFHEDIGLGLVLYTKLGALLDVPTPTARAFIAIGSAISDRAYLAEGEDMLDALGIDGLDVPALHAYLETGEREG